MPNILIVEDEPLIAMLLEDWLVELGHTPVGPALTLTEALKLAGDAPIDAAIVDYNVGADRADPLADLLMARGIPFAFASGESGLGGDERYAGLPKLDKPYVYDTLDAVLKGLLEGV